MYCKDSPIPQRNRKVYGRKQARRYTEHLQHDDDVHSCMNMIYISFNYYCYY